MTGTVGWYAAFGSHTTRESLCQASLIKTKQCSGDRLHFHIIGAAHSTLSDKKSSCYLFLFLFQSCAVLVLRERCTLVMRNIVFAMVVSALLKLVITTLYKCNVM